MATYILFFIGFAVLIKGADFLVSGASSLATRMGVSALVIGLTIVAFGTSTPELVVNLLASLEGKTGIAIGNVLGSNIANILLILGASAMVYPLAVGKGTVWKEIPLSFLAVVVLGVMANDVILDATSNSVITRIDGILLIAFFIIFLYYTFGIAKVNTNENSNNETTASYSYGYSFLLICLGAAGLVVGGKWIVDGATVFATALGVSEAIIGLTIVAVGTSLPELATSIVAAKRRNVDIAVGNIVGSNIFNVFWILGVSATISPLPFSLDLQDDLLVTILATGLLFVILFIGKRHVVERWQGGLFLFLYVAYIFYTVLRM